MSDGTTTSVATRVEDPLVRLEGLKKAFPIKAGVLQRTVAEVRAVDGDVDPYGYASAGAHLVRIPQGHGHGTGGELCEWGFALRHL